MYKIETKLKLELERMSVLNRFLRQLVILASFSVQMMLHQP